MIRPLCDEGVGTRASFVSKTFTVASSGKHSLRISALGLYRAFVNGHRVGDELLTPGWTSYQARLSYQTYEVGSLLQLGENVIEIWLGDGWYRSPLGWEGAQVSNTWGEHVAAIAELRDEAGDIVVATDQTWGSGLLPIHRNGIYFGEQFDARERTLTLTSGTGPVPSFDPATLIPHEVDGVCELPALPAVSQYQDEFGRTIYDFGQNCAGYVSFSVRGDRGACVTVEHAEVLDGENRFNNANLRSAAARIDYTLSGDGEEHYRPTFTFFGFRYARVAIEGRASLTSIVSIPISSVGRRAGSFTCGSPLVNRLVENTWWSQLSNFIEVPTDCPQRDERFGWTGDAQVFAPTACYLADSRAILTKWLRDVMADQRDDGGISHVSPDPYHQRPDTLPHFYGSTGWGDAICVVPWVLYQHYGDLEILRETLPAMVRWSDYIWNLSDNGLARPNIDWSQAGFTFGDWLQPKGRSEKPLPTIGDDAAATIYMFISADIIAKAAAALGDAGRQVQFAQRAAAIKAAFEREFVMPTGRLLYDDQTSYALAILHDLVPANLMQATRRYFRAAIQRTQGRIGTGFIGTPALLPALIKIGATDLASAVFLQEEVPGWLYQVKRGATTIWERWDAIQADGTIFDPSMNSFNHYSYGAVCEFLFAHVAGIRPDPQRPGFAHFVLEPTILPALGYVRSSHRTKLGTIHAAWSVEGDTVQYQVTVPSGMSAQLRLAPQYSDVRVDGAVSDRRRDLEAGDHVVTFRLPHAATEGEHRHQ
jgi:alpha-L-rhamnosidase